MCAPMKIVIVRAPITKLSVTQILMRGRSVKVFLVTQNGNLKQLRIGVPRTHKSERDEVSTHRMVKRT